VCEDITERKLAEEALRESEEKFREIFDKVNDAIHIVEMNKNGFPGKFIDINEAACRMLQYDREKLLRHTPLELTTDYYDPPLEQIRGEIRAHGHAIFETEYKRKDGTIVPVEVNVHNTVFQGKSVGIAIVRDITERKKAEAALRESEAKYRTIIENLQGMFYRTDRDGNLTMISPRGVKLAGYDSEEEMIGLNIARDIYQNPEERKRFLAALAEKGSVDNYPLVLKDRHGTPHIVTASSHFYCDDQGNVLGVEGILHDITEQKKNEDALAFMNKKLNLMSSITRHDILNQLTALSASIQLASANVKEQRTIEYLNYAEKTIDTIQRQIVFTTEYENIGIHAPVWQQLSDTVRSAVSQLHTAGVTIEITDNPVEIYADPLLERVFFNLIHNAMQHGEKVTRVSIFSNEDNRGLVISVADNGTGILPEYKNRLFVQGSGKHRGLGLFLAKEILAMTGMTIDETGEFGNGARFEIVVPGGRYRFIEPENGRVEKTGS
jgi:PAS domain S-box-containing protein